MNHLSEEDLILLYYYGESDAPEGASEHLRTCTECNQANAALHASMEMFDTLPVPEPRPSFEAEMWARVAPAAVAPRRRSRWAWLPAFAITAALIAAVILVRPPSQPVAAAPLTDEARQRILTMTLADHLDRTQMLLTEFENTADNPTDLEPLQARAQDLVDESRLMRQWLEKGTQPNTLAVVDEADRILTEAANAGGHPEDLRMLRERIGADSLLFKVRVVEANLR